MGRRNTKKITPEAQADVCVFADRAVYRSPTGTGTAGRVAQLYARGQLGENETPVNERIIGTIFTGRAVGHAKVGDFDAVIPEVGGGAAIIGFSQWVVVPGDPVGAEFFLR